MTEHSVEIQKITIPLARIASLSAQQRYAYYILGHIFNEMMALQKLLLFAIPKHDERLVARHNAEMAQLLMLFRVAGSKIYECRSTINCAEVGDALQTLVFADRPDLRDCLKALNKAIDGAGWLRRMRNGMGFHNPKFKDWVKYTTPGEGWGDDKIFVGEHTGNTFYDASASTAMHWMFDEYRDIAAPLAFDSLVDELIDLMKQLNGLVEQILGTMVSTLVPDAVSRAVAVVGAPRLDCIALPYWTYIPSADDMRQTPDAGSKVGG